MSEKIEVGQQHRKNQNASRSPNNLPEQQYSKEELRNLSKSPASARRPKCLEQAYDSEDGKWDPERWYRAKFSREDSPLTLADGKEQRKGSDKDRDFKKRPSVKDSVDHLKEERDGIVLSPQWRSFGTGGNVQAMSHPYTRHLSIPDKEDSRCDRDRDREKPIRKIGSGRLQIERENSRDYSSGQREHFDGRDHSRDHDRDLDFVWSRDRERNWDRDIRDRSLRDSDKDRDVRDRSLRDSEKDRDVRDRSLRDSEKDRDLRDRSLRNSDKDRDVRDRGLRDSDKDRDVRERGLRDSDKDRDVRERGLRDSDRDRRLDRSDRFHRMGERDFSDRDWRDRDFRDRGSDRNARRRNNRAEEREPEWFTGGPTSQNDTIELRGFDREEDTRGEDAGSKKPDTKRDKKTRITSSDDKLSRESPMVAVEPDVKVSGHSSPVEDQQSVQHEQLEHRSVPSHNQQEEEHNATTSQQNSRSSPTNTLVDFEVIMNTFFPMGQEESGIRHGSRFSQFFSGPGGNMMDGDMSCDDNHMMPSPTPMIGPMGAVQHAHLGMQHFQGQPGETPRVQAFFPHHMVTIPNSAGDNNATAGKSSLPPSVTALFNSAALGGSNAPISSSSSFSTQDAEEHLKAMLFGGNRDSTSSSGTASPANFPPGVHRKAKTVVELEADMHQNSPQKTNNFMSLAGGVSNSVNHAEATAFNKLLIMINAASEASQSKTQTELQQASHAGYGMVPSHNEFSHAVKRNKEKQMQLLHQSLQNAQGPLSGIPPQPPHHILHHIPPPLYEQQSLSLSHQQALYQQQHHVAVNKHKQLANVNIKPPNTPGLPQAMSTPQPNSIMKIRAQSGAADPIFSLIQHNPTIVMNPASPAPHMTSILAPQQSAVSSTARVPSPLMFNQQPPLHLSAPSPIHPGQLSPRSLTLGTNLTASALSSPTGMRSPVLPRVLSPQELSAHAQAVMQSALIKKQLQDQNERYLKKQQERAKSPNQQQINVVKPLPTAQPVIPPTPQPKGASMDTFTPTSVLRKMHSDKALEKEKHTLDAKEEEIEFMPSMHDLNTGGQADKVDGPGKSDLGDVSFLNAVSPNLVAMTNQLENQLRIGQSNVLPGSLSQPMSVEEKMKLLTLAEKPGYLSQMLDKSAAESARASHGRPIIKGEDLSHEDRQRQQYLPATQPQQQQPPTSLNQPPTSLNPAGRPVTGVGSVVQPLYSVPITVQTSLAQFSNAQQNSALMTGRAIVGGTSVQQQSPVASTQNFDMLRALEQQHFQQQYIQRLQQVPQHQGMGLPPPPVGTPIACLGPPPVAVPTSARIPLVGHPPNSTASAVLMHQQIARANAFTAQRNQQISHLMAMQHSQQQQLSMAPLPPLHTMMTGVSAHLSPRSQASGPLSPAALSAAIQKIASPLKMNGPHQPTPVANGGGGPKVDLASGIQRWFSPDILRNQLPSMPPLPTQGNKVMTVDELERN